MILERIWIAITLKKKQNKNKNLNFGFILDSINQMMILPLRQMVNIFLRNNIFVISKENYWVHEIKKKKIIYRPKYYCRFFSFFPLNKNEKLNCAMCTYRVHRLKCIFNQKRWDYCENSLNRLMRLMMLDSNNETFNFQCDKLHFITSSVAYH